MAAAQLEGFHSGAGIEFAGDGASARSICAGGIEPPLFAPSRHRRGCGEEPGGLVVRHVPALPGSLLASGAYSDRSFSVSRIAT